MVMPQTTIEEKLWGVYCFMLSFKVRLARACISIKVVLELFCSTDLYIIA